MVVHLSQLEDQSYRSTGDGGGWENQALISRHGFDEFRRRCFNGTSWLILFLKRARKHFKNGKQEFLFKILHLRISDVRLVSCVIILP